MIKKEATNVARLKDIKDLEIKFLEQLNVQD